MTTRAPAWTWPHLSALQQHGTRAPLVFVPGLRGTPMRFHTLVDLFGPQQPLWALQLLGEQTEEPVIDYSVEQTAAVFEPQLCAAIPEGPIVLGGFSMGALIAFELACRLRRRGREIPLLISLDGDAPQYRSKPVPWAARLRAHSTALRTSPRNYTKDRVRNWRLQLMTWFGIQWVFEPELRALDNANRERRKRLAALREQAAARYRPKEPLPVPLMLIRGTDPQLALGAIDDPAYGWSDYIHGSIDIVRCPGNHQTVMESDENRQEIVRAIAGAIDALARARPACSAGGSEA